MDVLAAADWIIEMGPDAGIKGGEIVAEGTPENICDTDTETARFLKHMGRDDESRWSQRHDQPIFKIPKAKAELSLRGAREHNFARST